MSSPVLAAARRPSRAFKIPRFVPHLLILTMIALIAILLIPGPAITTGARMWRIGAVILALALVMTRRKQPRIDDRDLDRILAVGGLVTAVWIITQWETSTHPVAAVFAAISVGLGLALWVVGTREISWLAPAILPLGLSLVPCLDSVLLGMTALALCALAALALTVANGLAPRGQFQRIVPARLVVPALAAIALAAVTRGWFA
ncbi:hypothetical protein [Actinomyces gaoshouyii]|uniref:Uncharacterized protein n=1 Tax=Actinomyces gaoshouyii TaxID=1960083 RepID=A0A8H9H8F4_9ACTO|nr:hypothetical protein [Actinomyces gaoshouyii]GGO97653.1 hypothetical protein GCM10011612_10700 [Actinomyces gaoshouyii]